MYRYAGWVLFCVMGWASAASAADLPFLERFALAEDRAEVIKELVPGTEDYYYFSCLQLQETDKLDDVNPLLEAWIGRYGETERAQEIRHRQALLQYPSKPEETLNYLKSIFGLSFDHQRQLPGEAPDLPTELDAKRISRETLLRQALDSPSYQDTIGGFRPHAYSWLLAADLSPTRLRNLLEQLNYPDYPGLAELIAKDLDAPNSGGFGSLNIHRALVREQLDALLHLKPTLLNDDAFIDVYLRRLLPGHDDTDWKRNPALMNAYLDRLWDFVQRLAPAQTSLKAHVLFHRLNVDQAQGIYDRDRFLQYIQIPRRLDYVNTEFLKKGNNLVNAADISRDFDGATGMPPAGVDEPLVKAYLQHFFETDSGYDAFKPYIEESYLRRVFAETKLLLGKGNLEQWYAWLDPAAVDALKNRVDVAFVPDNKQQFGVDEAVTLDVWVKNVDRLLVKVFEIDTRSYYEQFQQEINTAIDLDGLVANHEQVHTYTDPPLTRARRQFTFPELTGRGVWVIEFVGNGASSRAVVARGGLQYLSRTGAAGQMFTVFDESGTKVPDASIWFSGRTYSTAENGEITLPFSTEPGGQQFLLCQGDFATLAKFTHQSEQYRLVTGFHVDTESLRSGMLAKVALRPILYLNGAPMPLSLLKNPVLDIRSTTFDGIQSSQQINDIALQYGELAVREFRVPENLANLSFSLSGTVDRLTGGDPLPLRVEQHVSANGIHATQQTAALFLTRAENNYALELRDKNGLPLADRMVNFRFTHVDFTEIVYADLKTDAGGRVTLGELKDIDIVVASSPGLGEQLWNLKAPALTYPPALQGSTREPLRIPIATQDGEGAADVASLLEIANGVYVADRTSALEVRNGYLIVSDIPAGDYMLRLKDADRQIPVRVTDGEDTGAYVASGTRILEASANTALQIAAVEHGDSAVNILVGGANALTRVHVVATRFFPERDLFSQMNVSTPGAAAVRPVDHGYALYTTSRQIGDEYRYVLERRFAATYPGNMLERPSLLLNPWAIEETDASQEAAMADQPVPVETPPALRQKIIEQEEGRSESAAAITAFSPDFDFLDNGTAALYNLKPDENGVVTIPTADLQGRVYLQIVATDPFGTATATAALPDQAWTPRDLRLAKALDPESRLVEQKRVQVLEAGSALKVSLTGDAQVQVYDSVSSVLGLFMTLNGDAKLKEFSFVSRWPSLGEAEKREKFSSYESHELNFFLYHKDRAFFDAVVRPFLANKYHKTFLDQWLLDEDLTGYLDPWRLGQLNLVEKILLARRLPAAQAAVGPFVRDALDIIPPDPERFNALFMTALYGGALSGDSGRRAANFASHDALNSYYVTDSDGDGIRESGAAGFGGGGGGFGMPGNGGFDPSGGVAKIQLVQGAPAAAPAPEPKRSRADREADNRQNVETSKELPEGADAKGIKQYAFREPELVYRTDRVSPTLSELSSTLGDEARDQYRALYRAPEKTQALIENDYYKLTPAQANPAMIPVNAFWRDYAKADPTQPFLSRHIAEAASSFSEAMLALAVLDLPFESPDHQAESDQGVYTLQAGGAGIAFFKDIEAAEASSSETTILVSQNYFRADDRYRYEQNQQFDKFVSGEFLTGIVYGCQSTVTNPTSTPLAIEVLHQIPQGALPVSSGRYTKSERMGLDPYSTARVEYYFYFPAPGDFTHFPVHVSQDGKLLAFAEPQSMKAVAVPSTVDTTSWQYVSQQASADEVLTYLKENNLNRLDLNLLLWRMKDKAFYQQAITLLTGRAVYAPELWAYAIQHNDTAAIKTFLQYRDDFTAQAGPAIESALLTIDPVERETYQHMEFSPLINPRAHHLDGKWMISNAKLEQQYAGFVHVLAHRPALRAEDLLALSYYLLLQDRVGEAIAYFDRVNAEQLPARIQYDYLRAYIAFYREDPASAATIADQYKDYPVDRWRNLFAGVASQAAEIRGAAAPAGESRPAQDALASQEPQLNLELKEDAIVLNHANLTQCQLSFYPIDLEMLFTRSPFALAGSNVFAGVKPMATQTVQLDSTQTQTTIPIPPEFLQQHVIVKVEEVGISRSDIRYASSLVAQLVERYGQVQVTNQADGKPLSKVYVKVFAQLNNGETLFYRDGYTDLRGRFDYASSSTMDLANVKRFAILVISEEAGAKVMEAAPPTR